MEWTKWDTDKMVLDKMELTKWDGRLIDVFIRIILSVPFGPCHFVHTILSNAILSVYHFLHTILSVPFCPLPFCPRTTLFDSENTHVNTFYVQGRPPPPEAMMHFPHVSEFPQFREIFRLCGKFPKFY